MEYHDQPIDFVNKFYFRARSNDKHYRIIVNIFTITIPLPLALGLLLVFLILFYLYPMLASLVEWLLEVNYSHVVEPKVITNYKDLMCGLFKIKLTRNQKILRNMHVPALAVFNIAVTVALTVFTALSISRLHDYGKEVFCHVGGCGDDSESVDHLVYLTMNNVTSCISILITIAIITLWPTVLFCTNKFSRKQFVILMTASMISANIMFVGIYFLPYMVLAFINDPLQTASAYVMVVLLALCGYFTSFSIVTVLKCVGLPIPFILLATVLCTGYFIAILIHMLTLGSYRDFQSLRNLLLPLIIVMFTYLVFKPVKNQMMTKIVSKKIEADFDDNFVLKSRTIESDIQQ